MPEDLTITKTEKQPLTYFIRLDVPWMNSHDTLRGPACLILHLCSAWLANSDDQHQHWKLL